MHSGNTFSIISHEASLSLLRKIRDGQEDSLVEAHEQYAMLVYSLIYSILGDIAKSEEMTQAVFIALWDEAPRLNEAEFKLLDYLLEKTQALVESDLYASYGANAKELFLRNTKSSPGKHLVLGLLGLPENLRIVLYLAQCLGLSLEAIAIYLQEPLALVKSDLTQAMECLHLQSSLSSW